MLSNALPRRLLAEFLGTALLVTAIVGSGIMAQRLSPHDVGVQLFENVLAIILTLGALIMALEPISGAHFNPLVSAADWWLGRRTGSGISASDLAGYTLAQVVGAICGAILGNVMFALPPVTWSRTERAAGNLWLGEVVATAGLIVLIFALARSGRASASPAAVSAYLGGAAWFTSSTSFVNPALTVARSFTDTFTGIAPSSVPAFVLAEIAGLVIGVALLHALYPRVGSAAGGSVVEPPRGERLPERV